MYHHEQGVEGILYCTLQTKCPWTRDVINAIKLTITKKYAQQTTSKVAYYIMLCWLLGFEGDAWGFVEFQSVPSQHKATVSYVNMLKVVINPAFACPNTKGLTF